MGQGGVVKIPWVALIQDLKFRKHYLGFSIPVVTNSGFRGQDAVYLNPGCRRWGIDGSFIQSSIRTCCSEGRLCTFICWQIGAKIFCYSCWNDNSVVFSGILSIFRVQLWLPWGHYGVNIMYVIDNPFGRSMYHIDLSLLCAAHCLCVIPPVLFVQCKLCEEKRICFRFEMPFLFWQKAGFLCMIWFMNCLQ